MNVFTNANRHKIRGWRRRAETIKLKAQALLDDMVGEISEHATETDFADNVADYAEELVDMFDRWLAATRGQASPK